MIQSGDQKMSSLLGILFKILTMKKVTVKTGIDKQQKTQRDCVTS